MSVSCQVIMSAVEKVAPRHLAEEWDNVGLLVGDPAQAINRVMLTLDCTPEVVTEGIERKVDLILAHHPLIFSPMKQVRTDLPGQSLVAKLIRSGISFYAAHTNLDCCPMGGTNLIAKKLGLTAREFLLPGFTEKLYKLVVFVPVEYQERVREAMSKAGAGGMGDYEECFFQTAGTGTFRPLPGADPFIGRVGSLEKVDEIRLETIVPSGSLQRTIRAMLKVHPYEVPAYDILPTDNPAEGYGIGTVGYLPREYTLGELVDEVKQMLGNCGMRVAGDFNKKMQKAAVCTGSGGSLVRKAAFKGAGALIAGDISHHEALDALESGMAIIDPGHYATEWLMVENLFNCLKEQLAAEKRNVEIILSQVKTEPFVFI